MSLFSNALAVCLEEVGISKNRLAEISGVPQATMHRFWHPAGRGPDAEVLGKICRVFEKEEHKAAIIAAHLQDETPEDARHLVRVLAAVEHSVVAEDEADKPVKLPKKLRETFTYLQKMAVEFPAVADAVESTARLLKER